MKQQIKLFALSVVALSLVACGGGSGGDSADSGPGGSGGAVVMGQNGAVDVNTAGSFAVQMLAEVNAARAIARSCGTNAMAAVPPLSWNALLAAAAAKHSEDMATRGYFSHTSPEGITADDRIQEVGYKYTAAGENLASGGSKMSEIMKAWLNSPGHCSAMMSPDFKEMGASYAKGPGGQYWTQKFGAP